MKEFSVKTASAEETVRFGVCLGSFLKKGDLIALEGDLGGGKTTLVKGIVQGVNGCSDAEVTSPTFVLMHEYPGSVTVYHIDAYRLSNSEDARRAGLEEFLYGDVITVVEWADRIRSILPASLWTVTFKVEGETGRVLTIRTDDSRMRNVEEKWKTL